MKFLVETERFLLREIVPEDEQGLYELDSDPEVHRFLGNKPLKSIEEVRHLISLIKLQYQENGIGRWAIIEKATGSFVGWSGLKLVKEATNKHVNFYDVGYRLLRKYWGKGIATETGEASLNYGFTVLRLQQIYGMADVQNSASNRVLQKLGLKFIETFDFDEIEHNWYKITSSDWANKRSSLGQQE